MDPAGVFVLPPGAVQEVQLRVQPRKPGSKFVFLSMVDVEHHTLVTGWLLCLNIQKPLLSKVNPSKFIEFYLEHTHTL